jgi:TRAP-type C4-dicarboxylate transport system permease large subunit
VVFKNLHPLRDLPRALASGATLVGAVLILLGVALGLTGYLVDAQIPDRLVDWAQAHIHSPNVFLLALNGILLVLGSVLEMYSAIVAIAPLVVPLGKAFGIDPVHLGVVFLANLELGFLLPPMGLNLFLSATRFNQPLPRVYARALPFLAIMSAGVLIVTYVPSITTGVLALLGVH